MLILGYVIVKKIKELNENIKQVPECIAQQCAGLLILAAKTENVRG